MLDKIKYFIDSSTWFLRSDINPPKSYSKKLKSMNHMTSRKFAMTLMAVLIVAVMYFASVLFLFLFPSDPHVSALVNMYKDMIVAIAAIAGTLVGIQGLVDWRYNSKSVAEQPCNAEEDVNEEDFTLPEKEDDYNLKLGKKNGK